MRVGGKLDLGWIRRWLSDYNSNRGCALATVTPSPIVMFLLCQEHLLNLLAIENKQEQDDKQILTNLNHKLGSRI